MKKSFLGQGWSFPPDFSDPNVGVSLTSDHENIIDSIQAIIYTSKGERIMHVLFGCNLRDSLFESINNTEKNKLINRIKKALSDYEPRITVESIDLNLGYILEGKIEILVDFTIITTNERTNIVFPYYKNEATAIES